MLFLKNRFLNIYLKIERAVLHIRSSDEYQKQIVIFCSFVSLKDP